MSKLSLYNKKRDFSVTAEPKGKVETEKTFRFVVQEHHASRLHYDFRLQLDGVLKSWAVPKGPSDKAGEKRLAVMVEDHPVSYIGFKGTIPEGNYGAGTVTIWDKGNFTPIDEKASVINERQALLNLRGGELKFRIKGRKLKGSYVLVRMGETEKNWLLIKHRHDTGAPDGKTPREKKPMTSKKDDLSKNHKSATTKTILPKKEKRAGNTKEKQKEQIKIGRVSVTVTNTQKIFWPQEGYTKGNLIDFYRKIAPYILPYLKDRPLSLKRNPNGILDKGFYHKDAGENAPSFVKVFPYQNEKKIIDYIVCNNVATLLYLVNLGCIEFNPWNNRVQKVDMPDWLLIDLDPSEKNDFEQVIAVARAAKELMDKGKLKGYCKTSGASGLHIYLPLHAQYNYAVVKDFAEIFMQLLGELVPDFTSMERSLSKRGNNIYLDYLQNRTGQTLASAYSVRPVEGATVSTPLEWKEVKPGLHPGDFDIKNIFKRLEKKGDLFKPVLVEKNNLQKALKNLKS